MTVKGSQFHNIQKPSKKCIYICPYYAQSIRLFCLATDIALCSELDLHEKPPFVAWQTKTLLENNYYNLMMRRIIILRVTSDSKQQSLQHKHNVLYEN